MSGSTIDPSDIAVCFYGDLFRHDPEAVDSGHWTSTRAGVEDVLVETVGHYNIRDTLTQLAGRQTYERTCRARPIRWRNQDGFPTHSAAGWRNG